MTGEPFRVASEWVRAAAIAFAQRKELEAAEQGSLLEEHETPLQAIEAIRRDQEVHS
jgi:hypothetical protein